LFLCEEIIYDVSKNILKYTLYRNVCVRRYVYILYVFVCKYVYILYVFVCSYVYILYVFVCKYVYILYVFVCSYIYILYVYVSMFIFCMCLYVSMFLRMFVLCMFVYQRSLVPPFAFFMPKLQKVSVGLYARYFLKQDIPNSTASHPTGQRSSVFQLNSAIIGCLNCLQHGE
jgi:hypothetical protein